MHGQWEDELKWSLCRTTWQCLSKSQAYIPLGPAVPLRDIALFHICRLVDIEGDLLQQKIGNHVHNQLGTR